MTALLEGPRADGAFLLRMVMSAPWGVSVRDRAPLTVLALISGQAWIVSEGSGATMLRPRQVAVVRGPEPYMIASDPSATVGIVIHPGQRCEDVDGRSLEEPFMRGVRTWGNDPAGETEVIVGTYERLGESAQMLLASLPSLLVVEHADLGLPVVELIAGELARETPGHEVVLDRLLDLLTVAALRTWFDRSGTEAPGWYRASADPLVGKALSLLQHNPGHDWTVASLAAEVGASRASLARRFESHVGTPPITFLTEWRVALAADLLHEPGATVQSVAAKVGYGSGFALSAAFKRLHGISPTEHRARAAQRDRL